MGFCFLFFVERGLRASRRAAVIILRRGLSTGGCKLDFLRDGSASQSGGVVLDFGTPLVMPQKIHAGWGERRLKSICAVRDVYRLSLAHGSHRQACGRRLEVGERH